MLRPGSQRERGSSCQRLSAGRGVCLFAVVLFFVAAGVSAAHPQGAGSRSTDVEPASASAIASDGQPAWFFAVLGLLLGAGIFGFHRVRVARLIEIERVRTRIATDLHDDIGSSLTQIAILSEIARSRAEGHDPATANLLERIADTSRELVDSMSDVVWAINPTEDRLSDLVQRIRRFGTDIADSQNVEFRFRAPVPDPGVVVDADERREAYLVFKESVNNAIKHSGCHSVESDIAVENGWLVLRVHDDGRGFDTGAGSAGHGLASMRARARSLGGSFSIASSRDAGTTETLRLPLGRRNSWWTPQPRTGRLTRRFRFPRWSFGMRRPASNGERHPGWHGRGSDGEIDHGRHHRRSA